jgi:hypothetical protein
VVLALGLAGSIAITLHLGGYIADPTRTEDSLGQDSFTVHHCCLTAYANALVIVERNPTANPWGDRPDVASCTPFDLDAYEYPPPFLLLVKAVWAGSRSFEVLRLRFYVLQVSVLLLALLFLWRALRTERRLGATAALVVLAFLAIPTLDALQKGNAQVLVVGLVIGAIIAYDRGHDVLGGALIALPVLTKIYPGVLLIAWLGERRRRRVAVAMAWIAGLAILGIPILGWPVYATFVRDQLPQLLSGRAFAFMLGEQSANHSIQGIVILLHRLGIPVWVRAAHAVAALYGLGLCAAAGYAGRRWRDCGAGELAPVVGALALYGLSERLAPFAPMYILIAPTIVALILAGRSWVASTGVPRLLGIAMASLALALFTAFGAVGGGRTLPRTLLSLSTSIVAVAIAGIAWRLSLPRAPMASPTVSERLHAAK